MIFLNKQKGFSNLELIVVITIIMVLAIISFLALNDQRAKARDAKRISDVRQIRTALEFYFSDEDAYPIVEEAISLGEENTSKLCSAEEGGFVSGQTTCTSATTYMSLVPTDPFANQDYKYIGNADNYNISFILEKESELGLAGAYVADSGNIYRR